MILKKLKIETLIGNYTNCYIIADEDKKEAMVIDPAGETDKIMNTIKLLDVKVKYIYLTHCHADHIGSVEELKQITNAKILIYRKEAENLQDKYVNLCEIVGIDNIRVEADARVDEGDILHIRRYRNKGNSHTRAYKSVVVLYILKNTKFYLQEILYLKEHMEEQICQHGSEEDIINSIKKKILILPDDTLIYPGHGDTAMLEEEKRLY